MLNLSNNHLSGKIPLSFTSCSSLKVLKLDNNRLTGQIPQQLSQLHGLSIFNVANNLLSGPVPDSVRRDTITPDSYVNNSGLCGGPLDSCKKHRWTFEIEVSFRSGFALGFVVFASIYTAFFTYFFNLWVESKKSNKVMPTKTRVLTVWRKNNGKNVDQLTQLPTKAKGLQRDEFMKVLFLTLLFN